MAVMSQGGTTLHYHIDIPSPLPLSACDLCALFANALDNAIEACEKLLEVDRQITLGARAAKGLLVI